MGVPKTLPRRERTSLPAACGGLPSGFWVRPKSNSPWPVRCSPLGPAPPPPPKMLCNRLRPGCVSEGCEAGSSLLVFGPTAVLLKDEELVLGLAQEQHVVPLALVEGTMMFAAAKTRHIGGQGSGILRPTEGTPFTFEAIAQLPDELEEGACVGRDFDADGLDRKLVVAPLH